MDDGLYSYLVEVKEKSNPHCISGHDLIDLSLIEKIKDEYEQSLCIIEDWCQIELCFEKRNLKISKVFSDCVVYDEVGRYDVGEWVLSSEIIEVSAEYKFFVTSNTVYLLQGEGKHACIS